MRLELLRRYLKPPFDINKKTYHLRDIQLEAEQTQWVYQNGKHDN